MKNIFKPDFAAHKASDGMGVNPDVLSGPATSRENAAKCIPPQKVVDAIVKKRVYASLAAGFVPGPFADMAALSVIQLEMLRRLSRAYNISFEAQYGRKVLGCMASNLFPALVAANIFDVTRYMPFVGKGIAMGLANGAATYAVGYAFAGYFTYGENYKLVDMETLAREVKAQFRDAKRTVRRWFREDVHTLSRGYISA